ncbi:MAG: hypothetical protein GY859_40105, partial [Desulfobacterales bacterium]|nr:hypothetical protein [Desulfobacterales bacterium]
MKKIGWFTNGFRGRKGGYPAAVVLLAALFISIFGWRPPPAISAELAVGLDGSQGFTTIQGALDAAGNGDSILVHDGLYTETSQITKSVTLGSVNGFPSTAIRGESPGHVVDISGTAPILVTLDGLSIHNTAGDQVAAMKIGPNAAVILSEICIGCNPGLEADVEASSISISAGDSAVLKWETNAEYCVIDPGGQIVEAVGT